MQFLLRYSLKISLSFPIGTLTWMAVTVKNIKPEYFTTSLQDQAILILKALVESDLMKV